MRDEEEPRLGVVIHHEGAKIAPTVPVKKVCPESLLSANLRIMRKHIFVLAGMVLPLFCSAQSNYAVTVKGDTLRGTIQLMTYDLQDRLVITRDKKKENYTALQVPTLYLDSVLYKVQRLDNGYRYMQVLKSGFLSLYGFRMKNQFGFDGRMLIKMDGSKLEVPNIGFKKQLSEFLGDCDVLAERIRNAELGRKEIDQIIDLYNECAETKKAVQTLTQAAMAAPNATATPQATALEKLAARVRGAALANQKDVDDLIADMATKLTNNQKIPNYQIGALKEFLAGKGLDAELNAFLSTLEN